MISATHGSGAGARSAGVLWRDTEAEFHGEHANLSPSWAWPKPVRQPSVPVLLGCRLTPSGYAEIIGRADGWIGYASDLDLLTSQVTALRSRWTQAGRASAGPLIRPMLGIVDDDTLRRSFERFRAMEVDQVVLRPMACARPPDSQASMQINRTSQSSQWVKTVSEGSSRA